MGKPVIRVTDLYINPTMQGAASPIASMGSASLFVQNLPVVQLNNTLLPIPDTAIPGATTVFHNGLPLQATGDLTGQGGSLLMGATTVLIG
jgi:uncharacterized Zn-binding protein involved in type VI secretion